MPSQRDRLTAVVQPSYGTLTWFQSQAVVHVTTTACSGSLPRSGSSADKLHLLELNNNEDDSRTSSIICRPHTLSTRIMALFLMSLLGFGSFFCFDNPGALQSQLMSALNLTGSEFSSLYSWYSWPNVFLPVAGGHLVDRVVGLRVGTVLFTCFLVVGQLILSLSSYLASPSFMNLARFMFGVGGESLSMALNKYTVAWFRGKELNLVFGLQLSIARLGSTMNFLTMCPVYTALEPRLGPIPAVAAAFLFSSLFVFLSLFCSLLLGWLDDQKEKYLKIGGSCLGDADSATSLSLASPPSNDDKAGGLSSFLASIQRLPLCFWLLCCVTLSYYGTTMSFISFSQGFLRESFATTDNQANLITGLLYLVAAVTSPIFGLMIDRSGRNITWVVAALLVCAVSMVGLSLSSHSFVPYVVVVLMGLSYSVLASALWSLPALMVDDDLLATAYGVMQALQNLGVGAITMGAGCLVDRFGYAEMQLFFICCVLIAAVSSVSLWLCDRKSGGLLNLPNQSADQHVAQVVVTWE